MTMIISEDSKELRVLDMSRNAECITGGRKCQAKSLPRSRLIHSRTPRRWLSMGTVMVEYVRIVREDTGTYCVAQNNTGVRWSVEGLRSNVLSLS